MSPPNTAIELVKTRRAGCGSARQASSTARVPSTLTRMPRSKSASAAALTTAARWNTLPVLPSMVRATSARSAMSPVTARTRLSGVLKGAGSTASNSTSSSMGCGLPSRPGSSPSASSRSANWRPMKPAPPVMTTFMPLFLRVVASALL